MHKLISINKNEICYNKLKSKDFIKNQSKFTW